MTKSRSATTLFSFARVGALVIACWAFDGFAGSSHGMAQQPAPPARDNAPGPVTQLPGIAGAGAGQRAGAQGRGGGLGGVPLGDGPWVYGNGPNRYRVVVV